MTRAASRPRNPYRRLIHLLNARYHREWLRAERLQRELDRRLWLGPAFGWLRAIKRRLFGAGPADDEVDTGPFQPVTAAPRAAGRVSVIIPFRDRLELLRTCLASLRLTDYAELDVVLVDNGSAAPAMGRYLRRVTERGLATVIARPGAFNFSWLCNEGARQAAGEWLLFLNNDTEVIDPAWLRHLLRLGGAANVGAVGATLLFPDGTLQHAGAWPRGDGRWVHAHKGARPGAAWPAGAAGDGRAVPAVTAACLLIRRGLFASLGGFDERLAVAGNDVELCRRVRGRGLDVVVSRHARLLHYEGLSRGRKRADDEAIVRAGRGGVRGSWHGSSSTTPA